MKSTVTIETQRGALGEYLLVSVENGKGIIGVCDTTAAPHTKRETFYVEAESLINTFSPSADPAALRQIWQCSTIDRCQPATRKCLEDSTNEFFYENMPLSRAIAPVLELLNDGLYVVHVDKTYPTDGAGNFFWNAYLVRHELNGSAPLNPVLGDQCFSPPFLVPTRSCSAYNEQGVSGAIAGLKRGRKIGGIAYHLTGMFSALLCGHMNAAACLMRGVDFPCVIIEPLSEVLYERDEETGTERVAGLGCPYIKLPITAFSRNMLEGFLMNRRSAVPDFYGQIRKQAEKILQPKNAIKDMPVLTRQAESLPDAEMLASAFAVKELTDEQLDLLLSGETTQNEQVIISSNYYESIVYACNFLQYTSTERFIRFTVSVLNTPSLSATFRYVAERLRYIMDARINETFTSIRDSEDPVYIPLKEAAAQYAQRYGEYMEDNVKSFLDDDLPPVTAKPALAAAQKIEAAAAETASGGSSNFSSMALKKEMERSTGAKPAEG